MIEFGFVTISHSILAEYKIEVDSFINWLSSFNLIRLWMDVDSSVESVDSSDSDIFGIWLGSPSFDVLGIQFASTEWKWLTSIGSILALESTSFGRSMTDDWLWSSVMIMAYVSFNNVWVSAPITDFNLEWNCDTICIAEQNGGIELLITATKSVRKRLLMFDFRHSNARRFSPAQYHSTLSIEFVVVTHRLGRVWRSLPLSVIWSQWILWWHSNRLFISYNCRASIIGHTCAGRLLQLLITVDDQCSSYSLTQLYVCSFFWVNTIRPHFKMDVISNGTWTAYNRTIKLWGNHCCFLSLLFFLFGFADMVYCCW